ncbi:RidA family protein [Paenibacillus sp. IB182496]|uniref:RidA family protein n=1 Tax=Paenibacillus sabuli TaxID=2772509 RepID=A0A927GQW6_9BACL|nr:RidA family protein [Paenibacillus sabuli]MBD2844803.1 RidA family protein [Paenibacillus sabuli]
MGKIEARLKELGIELEEVQPPKYQYVPAKVFGGNLVYTSGQDCRINGELMYTGKVGKDLTLEQAREAARRTAINCIKVIKYAAGDLDRVKQVVKVLGWVNSADGFVEQPLVIDACSELMYEVFGEKGRHARSAVSANELPFDTPVEIEMIVELED